MLYIRKWFNSVLSKTIKTKGYLELAGLNLKELNKKGRNNTLFLPSLPYCRNIISVCNETYLFRSNLVAYHHR